MKIYSLMRIVSQEHMRIMEKPRIETKPKSRYIQNHQLV